MQRSFERSESENVKKSFIHSGDSKNNSSHSGFSHGLLETKPPEGPPLRLRGGAGDSLESFVDEAKQAIEEVSRYQCRVDYIKHKMGNDRYTLYLSYRNKADGSTEELKASSEQQRYGRLFDRIKSFEGEDWLLEDIANFLYNSSFRQKRDTGKGSRSQPYEQQEVAASSNSGDSNSQQQHQEQEIPIGRLEPRYPPREDWETWYEKSGFPR